ncbi:wall-associated receptor kinase 2-like [Hordeum vulgare subsp. vulgare]|uniref:Protein kinase domain-containing protein n=1 Tax=Hordeum vulgare subsp. vulgare TaxID=112509 RepID=A0A8I6WP08_HORVV|nr:wall-associated receptor kinase 2-like [Hordeum vulgare subsp. vulgare]
MQLMLMALPLLLLLAASESLTATTTGGGGCPASCGGVDIPYPFGISPGCFRKGFEIGCSSKDGPVLAGTPLRVVHLSVDPDESLVMLPMGWKCYNASSPTDAVGSSYGETTMNKDGVYRISHTHNMLVVNGCNTMGYTASTATEGGASAAYAYYTGCMSYCNNSASAQDGLCSGVGCCHVDIPPGLTHNYFKFSAYSHENMMEYSPCDYAFLVDRTNYTFRRSDLKMDTNRTSPVWLDWAIRGNGDNDTHLCKQAAAATDQYACVSAHSDCIDSANGPGYNCKCSKGYKGNAYIVQGCTNIDECADPGKYPCKGVCTDTNGSYQCECPPGYRSYDPITERCTPKFPLAAQISVGAIGGLLVLAFLAFIVVLRKEKQKAKDFYRKNGGLTLENARSIKIYTKDELKPVLKSSNLIGKGGFGEVYKGVVDGVVVAVKKPISGSVLENKQFPNEVSILSQVIHKNIVRLIGCCLEVDTPMLVYEFISKGSLEDILHKELLNLDVRVSILQESAHGLAYMHSQAHTKILHGDVKPANILLNDNFVPKISDFGISRLIAVDKEHTANIIGDMTYMDPVYLQTGLLTEKSDVYSFGVVILELISRKKATHSDNNSLVRSFLECHQKGKKATELFDENIATTDDLEFLDKLAKLAMECLNLDADQRPSMTDVAERLLILHRSRKQ